MRFLLLLLFCNFGIYGFTQDNAQQAQIESINFEWGERLDILNRRLEKQEQLAEGMLSDLRGKIKEDREVQEVRFRRLESLVEKLKPSDDSSFLSGLKELRSSVAESRKDQRILSNQIDYFNARLLSMSERFAPGLWVVERVQKLIIGLIVLVVLVFILLLILWGMVRGIRRKLIG